MRESLEVNSQSPLYSQLADAILNAIKAGEFKSGDKIPSEEELRKMYGLSRVTVRTAIDSLVEKNILIKKQGKGTFVTVPALESNAQKLQGFTDIFSKHGYDLKKEILSVMVIPAPVSCVQDFKIQPNDNVIEVRRILLIKEIRTILETIYFPVSFSFILQEDLTQSLYGILHKHGIYPTMAKKKIDICYATAEEAKLLDIKPKKALFLCTDFVNDQEGNCIHKSRQLIRSDIYKLTVYSTNVDLEMRS